MDRVLLIKNVGAVRTLILNRPDRLNSLSDDLMAALNAAFADLETDEDVRAVLLTGAGRGFCAGGDLAASVGARSGV